MESEFKLEMGLFIPVVQTITNTTSGETVKYYLKEIEAIAKGKLELSEEEKNIIIWGHFTNLYNEGIRSLAVYEKNVADGSIKPFKKVILSKEDE